MSSNSLNEGVPVAAHPPLFGVRRPLSCPTPVRTALTAGDGAALQVHHIAGGDKGPVILAPGTAMSALCFLTDTTEQSFAEYLAAEGFDIWLFDWRTSPYLATTRYKGTAAYIDLDTQKFQPIWNLRAACSNNIFPANGVLNVPNLSGGCTCNYTPTSMALVPRTALTPVKKK